MLDSLFFRLTRRARRWLYATLAIATALSLVVGTAQISQAGWFDNLLRQGIQVIQLSTLSDSQEANLGQQINQQIVRQVPIYTDPQIASYVDRVGQRLVPYSARPDIPYTFQVVRDDSINAFATMGGYVYVHTGLMKAAENEAELASVVAHEIGHIAGRHALKQMRENAIAQGVLSATGLDTSRAVAIGVELALSRPNSREDEYEADEYGLNNLYAAGYAPSAMVSFMQKLQQQGQSVPTFLSTHPATADRVDALQAAISNAGVTGGGGLDSQAYRQQIQFLR